MVPGTSLYFDPGQSGHSNNGATASGCAGNPSLNVWNATATDWYNPQTNSDVAWASGKAYFEGAGGTVTVSGTFSTLGMTIAPTSGAYTLTGGTIGLSTNTLSVTGSAAIGSGLTGSNCGVTMHGGGTLILSGTDSFSTTCATSVLGGTLEAATPTALAGCDTSGGVAVSNGATLVAEAGGSGWAATDIHNFLTANGSGFAAGSLLGIDTTGASLSYTYGISGSMGLAILGGNTLTLTGANTYTGATTISAGSTLQVGGGGAGSINDTSGVSDSGTLAFDASSGTFSQNISGSGGVTQMANTLTLTGSNTYTGATAINAGELVLGNADAVEDSSVTVNVANGLGFATGISTFIVGGLAGSGNFAVGSGVTLQVGTMNTPVNTTTYSGVLSGSGSLCIGGPDTLIFTGADTYSGSTTISQGTLQIGSGGSAGSISGTAITDNGSLVFDRSDTPNYSGVISGSGSLTQGGSGTLTLTGANTYSGRDHDHRRHTANWQRRLHQQQHEHHRRRQPRLRLLHFDDAHGHDLRQRQPNAEGRRHAHPHRQRQPRRQPDAGGQHAHPLRQRQLHDGHDDQSGR